MSQPVGRRALLAAPLVALPALGAAGCTPRRAAAPVPPPRATLDRDAPVLTEVLATTDALRIAYAATMRRHPATRTRLGELAAEHDAHAAALTETIRAVRGGATSPSGLPTPAAPTRARSSEAAVAPRQRVAMAALAAREDAAARAHADGLEVLTAESARLVAGVCAARAAHAALLRAAR